MSKPTEQIGAVYPPNRPRELYDSNAKTSRVAVCVGIIMLVGQLC